MNQSLVRSGLPVWDAAMSATGDHRPKRGRPDWSDIAFFIALTMGAAYAMNTYGVFMNYYEKIILVGAVGVLSWMGWLWRPLRTLMIAAGLSAQIGRAHV